jgi:hydrogenase maturation protease
MIRIVGIGSPFGDDAAGLEAGRILAAAPPPGCEVLVEDRPGVSLLDVLENAEAVIVIDAVVSGARPGTVHDLPLADAERFDVRMLSSHDLPIGAALALARKLGHTQAQGRFIGVEAEAVVRADLRMISPAVRKAIPILVDRACWWAARMCRERRS